MRLTSAKVSLTSGIFPFSSCIVHVVSVLWPVFKRIWLNHAVHEEIDSIGYNTLGLKLFLIDIWNPGPFISRWVRKKVKKHEPSAHCTVSSQNIQFGAMSTSLPVSIDPTASGNLGRLSIFSCWSCNKTSANWKTIPHSKLFSNQNLSFWIKGSQSKIYLKNGLIRKSYFLKFWNAI